MDLVRDIVTWRAASPSQQYDQHLESYERLAAFTDRKGVSEYVLSLIDSTAENFRNVQILDIASGTGLASGAFTDKYPTITTDVSPRALKNYSFETQAPKVACDFESLPFAENIASHVVCIGGYRYLKDEWRLASELARVLVPGGLAIFTEFRKYSGRVQGERLKDTFGYNFKLIQSGKHLAMAGDKFPMTVIPTGHYKVNMFRNTKLKHRRQYQ